MCAHAKAKAQGALHVLHSVLLSLKKKGLSLTPKPTVGYTGWLVTLGISLSVSAPKN